MITLADLMFLINDSCEVQIHSNNSEELLIEGEALDVSVDLETDETGIADAIVMDVYASNNVLIICVEV